MKKRVISLALAAVMSSVMLSACSSSDKEAAATPDKDKEVTLKKKGLN